MTPKSYFRLSWTFKSIHQLSPCASGWIWCSYMPSQPGMLQCQWRGRRWRQKIVGPSSGYASKALEITIRLKLHIYIPRSTNWKQNSLAKYQCYYKLGRTFRPRKVLMRIYYENINKQVFIKNDQNFYNTDMWSLWYDIQDAIQLKVHKCI